jgi:hypothetical protein
MNTSASNVNYPSVDEQLVERSSELKVLASRAAFLQINAGLGGIASHRVRTARPDVKQLTYSPGVRRIIHKNS